MSSSQPPQLHDDEMRIHALFRVLREQTVEVARGLSERVSAHLSEAEDRRTQSPGVRSILSDAVVQFLNLISGTVAPPEEGSDHEP